MHRSILRLDTLYPGYFAAVMATGILSVVTDYVGFAALSAGLFAAAQQSPVYQMAIEYRVALPLHPEFRTLPMVWYVPPLSPIMNHLANEDGLSSSGYLAALDDMRIPMEYLASILTAGDVEVIRSVLRRLTAMRAHMRGKTVGDISSDELVRTSGLSGAQLEAMARLFGVAKYNERFVIPTGQREMDQLLPYEQGACSIEELSPPEGPGALIGWDS